MPGRKWTGEEKAIIVLEMMTTSTSTAEVCRRYNVRPTLIYSWRASFVQAGDREKQLSLCRKSINRISNYDHNSTGKPKRGWAPERGIDICCPSCRDSLV